MLNNASCPSIDPHRLACCWMTGLPLPSALDQERGGVLRQPCVSLRQQAMRWPILHHLLGHQRLQLTCVRVSLTFRRQHIFSAGQCFSWSLNPVWQTSGPKDVINRVFVRQHGEHNSWRSACCAREPKCILFAFCGLVARCAALLPKNCHWATGDWFSPGRGVGSTTQGVLARLSHIGNRHQFWSHLLFRLLRCNLVKC